MNAVEEWAFLHKWMDPFMETQLNAALVYETVSRSEFATQDAWASTQEQKRRYWALFAANSKEHYRVCFARDFLCLLKLPPCPTLTVPFKWVVMDDGTLVSKTLQRQVTHWICAQYILKNMLPPRYSLTTTTQQQQNKDRLPVICRDDVDKLFAHLYNKEMSILEIQDYPDYSSFFRIVQ